MSADELPEYNPHARAALMQGLEDQLRSSETPEVRAELDRLVTAGVNKKEAKEMMATILAFHIARLMKAEKPFDNAAYLAELRRLPEIDYDQEL
jgi:formate dehydrogenase maturation protein FdhE